MTTVESAPRRPTPAPSALRAASARGPAEGRDGANGAVATPLAPAGETAGSREAAELPRPGRRTLAELVEDPDVRLVVLAASKDENAKITTLVFPPGASSPTLAVKAPTTAAAELVVRREARVLVDLRRMRLAEVEASIPRLVGLVDCDGRVGLVASCVPGVPMSIAYHSWGHTASSRKVATDFDLAARWLATLQTCSARERAPVDLLSSSLARLERRWPGQPGMSLLLESMAPSVERLAEAQAPRTVVHGDYWFGNLLVSRGAVSGVVDWEAGQTRGEPLRDLARFPLSYALYLDRHTRLGGRVRGHRGLRAGAWGIGLRYALDGSGWFPSLVRDFVEGGLTRLGVRPDVWRDVLVAGVADVAATADHPEFARRHLELLWRLAQPTEGRRTR